MQNLYAPRQDVGIGSAHISKKYRPITFKQALQWRKKEAENNLGTHQLSPDDDLASY